MTTTPISPFTPSTPTQIIHFTTSALDFIKRKINQENEERALNLSLKKVGCSGFSYDLSFVNLAKAKELNKVIEEIDDIYIALDPQYLSFFKGTLVDCIQDDFGESLKFTNPNAKGECGCGESFTIDETNNLS